MCSSWRRCAGRLLPALAAHAPLLPGADAVAYVDIDDTIRRTYGYAKQGAGIGYSKVKGLNALIGLRLHSVGAAGDRGRAAAPRRDQLRARCGEFRSRGDPHRARRRGDRDAGGAGGFGVLRRGSRGRGPGVGRVFLGDRADESPRSGPRSAASTKTLGYAIKYPQAVWDEEGQCWISDAEIAAFPTPRS